MITESHTPPAARPHTYSSDTRDFVSSASIVRKIWGNADMVLLVFAGSAAEFALNRAVDWLFFTGKLPNDPIGRLFSTASYAQHIVFADQSTARETLRRIRAVHEGVERKRGQRIPDWAHRDVLYMLIDYSERAHEILARPLDSREQEELYDVFHRVGSGLAIPDLPATYADWKVDRERHLRRDLLRSAGTDALYGHIRNHLGIIRYHLLRQLQSVLTPAHVRGLLELKRAEWLRPLLRLYPVLASCGLRPMMQRLLVPPVYLDEVRSLEHVTASAREPGRTPVLRVPRKARGEGRTAGRARQHQHTSSWGRAWQGLHCR